MEQYLSPMIDVHEMYPEAFRALVDEYNTLGEHIVSLGEARQSYRDASTEVLTQFNAAGGPCISDLSIQNLNAQRESFILACENFIAFMDSRFQHIRELVAALLTKATETASAAGPDNAQPRDHLVLSSQGQGDMESDTGHGDEADASEEHKMAVSYALMPNLDLHSLEPEETVHNDTAAQEETMDHKMAASQVP